MLFLCFLHHFQFMDAEQMTATIYLLDDHRPPAYLTEDTRRLIREGRRLEAAMLAHRIIDDMVFMAERKMKESP